jgi:hypothetical protein
MMRLYNVQHPFYCGIHLHARTMHLCILDQAGNAVFNKNLPCRPESLLRAIEPYRENLVVGVECMFAWYWVADLCVEQNITFVLGHALYMTAIHGGKTKNDRIDAGKLARLLRGGTFPIAYASPKGMRETRDLLRRRTYLVRKRAELLTHLQILNAQYNLAPVPKKLSFAANRLEMNVAERFADLPNAAQGRSVRRGSFLERRGGAKRYGPLFSVSQGGGACRGLIVAKHGRGCVWPRCSTWSASRRRDAGPGSCVANAQCISRARRRAARSRLTWPTAGDFDLDYVFGAALALQPRL